MRWPSLCSCDRLVGRCEDIGLAGVKLTLHATNNPVTIDGGHYAFERGNYRFHDNSVLALEYDVWIAVKDTTCAVTHWQPPRFDNDWLLSVAHFGGILCLVSSRAPDYRNSHRGRSGRGSATSQGGHHCGPASICRPQIL